MGKSSIDGPFSMAMLNNQMVTDEVITAISSVACWDVQGNPVSGAEGPRWTTDFGPKAGPVGVELASAP